MACWNAIKDAIFGTRLQTRRFVVRNFEQLFDFAEGNRRGCRRIGFESNPAQFRRAFFEHKNYIP